jgi:hypothetical protein
MKIIKLKLTNLLPYKITLIAIYKMFKTCHFEPPSILWVRNLIKLKHDKCALKISQSLSLLRNDIKNAKSIEKYYSSFKRYFKKSVSGTVLRIIAVSASLVLLTSCIGMQSGSESWEGISGETLKVTVYEFFLFEEKATSEDVKNQIMGRLNQRAALLIASHISMSLSRDKISKSNDTLLNTAIDEIIQSGRLTDYSCGENNYCSAYSEYNIAGLKQTLELINNQP